MARFLIRFQVPAQISAARKKSAQRAHYRIAHVGGLRGKIRFIENATQQGAGGKDHSLSLILLSLILRVGTAWENQQKKKAGKYTGETISFHIRPPGVRNALGQPAPSKEKLSRLHFGHDCPDLERRPVNRLCASYVTVVGKSPSARAWIALYCHIARSEEHTSELQSHLNLVCRLLLEKKKKTSRTLSKK